MRRIRVRVTGSPSLRERVVALDGVTVVDADADCVVTDDPSGTDGPEPTVVVADGIADTDDSLAGFVPADAPDTQLADQFRLVTNAGLGRARSKAEHLHDITREIVACDDPDHVYRLAAEAADHVLEFDISYVAEAGETYFVPKAMSETMGDDGYTHEMRIDEGIAGQTYQSGESVLVDDVLTLAHEPSVDETVPTDVAEYARTVKLDDYRVDDDLPTVEADPDSLLRLLENLLRNAREHAGPDVTVRVAPLTDGAHGAADGFAVADDGPGIAPDEREQVFDSGYTSGGGTGLGLPIVQSIAEGHGWSVTVTESASGGARFDVRTE